MNLQGQKNTACKSRPLSVALSLVYLDSARVWPLCQAIDGISVLPSLCQVLANPVTFSEEITHVFLLQMAFHRRLEPF